jgi:Cu/Ag efflux protein CusF
MKLKHLVLVSFATAMSFACEQKVANNTAQNASPKPSATDAVPTPTSPPDLPTTSKPAPTPKNGDYDGKGVVTKINMELGSVEVSHEEIKDLMPAMTMEFFVSDQKMLEGLKSGDKVEFVIRYKDRNETIVRITKTK